MAGMANPPQTRVLAYSYYCALLPCLPHRRLRSASSPFLERSKVRVCLAYAALTPENFSRYHSTFLPSCTHQLHEKS